MTTPFDNTEDISVLRKRWWNRYLSVQTKTDTQIRTVLVNGATDAQDRINSLANNPTFSAGVRTTQLKLALAEVKKSHNDIFNELLPIITTGQQSEASAAMDGLSETDLQYIRSATASLSAANDFLKSAKASALLGVTHALSRVQHTDTPLSARVFRTQSLANRWVQNAINNALIKGDSANDLAKEVKKHILPTTPGGTSYAALRLGRTELNNAFHATAVVASQDRPWITGNRWNLSATHITDPHKIEVCDRMAGQLYPVDSTPGKPHPQCRCWISPELITIEQFNHNLTSGQYKTWMDNNAQQSAA
jgi:hypothetical protein